MNILNLLTKKNLKLNKKRTIVTIIGIILSVALIMAVSTMYFSLIASLIKYEKREMGNFHVLCKDVNTKDVNELFKDEDFDANYKTAQDYVNYILYVNAKDKVNDRLQHIEDIIDVASAIDDIPFSPRHSF